MTAGEVASPEKTMPRAVNNVIWRILIFYIGAFVRADDGAAMDRVLRQCQPVR
jgi:L-asparagine transporter-like permease